MINTINAIDYITLWIYLIKPTKNSHKTIFKISKKQAVNFFVRFGD